ncbi:hypothetical protein, partial [Shewanella algae]|uniref:hypothetical protein n=1 Tax=Shewanella algae TaxID=38313 RepID=UPI00313D5619
IGSSIAYECQDFDSGFQRLIVEAVIEAISSNGYVKVKLARGGVHSDCSQTEGWLKVSEWFE